MRFDPQSNTVPSDAGFEDVGRVKSPRQPGRKGGGAAGALILLFVAVIGAGAWYVDRSGGLEPALASASIELPPEVAALLHDEDDRAEAPSGDDAESSTRRFVLREEAEAAAAAAQEQAALDSADDGAEELDRTAFETGKAFMAIGRHADAVPHLREAVSQEPDFAEGWYKLGMACAMAGDNDQAREAQVELQKLDSSRASMLASIISRR